MSTAPPDTADHVDSVWMANLAEAYAAKATEHATRLQTFYGAPLLFGFSVPLEALAEGHAALTEERRWRAEIAADRAKHEAALHGPAAPEINIADLVDKRQPLQPVLPVKPIETPS